jgi:hypothetical protein
MVTALVMLGFVLIRVAFVALFAWLLVPRGRACPSCGEVTVRLAARGPARWLFLERRWCLACGWSWYRKRLESKPEVVHQLAHQRASQGAPPRDASL